MRKRIEGLLASMALAAFMVAGVSAPTQAATAVVKGDCILKKTLANNVIKSCSTTGTCSTTQGCIFTESTAIDDNNKEYITDCTLIPC